MMSKEWDVFAPRITHHPGKGKLRIEKNVRLLSNLRRNKIVKYDGEESCCPYVRTTDWLTLLPLDGVTGVVKTEGSCFQRVNILSNENTSRFGLVYPKYSGTFSRSRGMGQTQLLTFVACHLISGDHSNPSHWLLSCVNWSDRYLHTRTWNCFHKLFDRLFENPSPRHQV